MTTNYLRFVVSVCGMVALSTSIARAATLPSLSIPVLAQIPSMGGDVDATWAGAAKVSLDYDFNYRHAATEPTTVYIGQDPDAIDVAFVVTQRSALTAAQVTNGPGVSSEDNVTVYLNPQGTGGFAYSFSANPRGARFQTSSENTAYEPQWRATGKITPVGYTVTMRIPFAVMRSGGSARWRAQFARVTVATGGEAVWSYVVGQRTLNDPTYFGTMTDIHGPAAVAAAPARTKPRLELYGLGELTTAGQGGDTSRMGADLSLPVSSNTSLVATVHPDYSNVEVDQQTISPNAFQRQFNEVRPFFTQLTQYFDGAIGCIGCPTALYTPAIPTFRDGYAVEGTQGPWSYAGFDAIGFSRSDQAAALDYVGRSTASTFGAFFQQVGVDLPGLHDRVDTIFTGYHEKRSGIFAYANDGEDRSNFTTDPAHANYFEAGTGYAGATATAIVTYQSVGAQYLPADGFVSQSDTAGLETNYFQTWNFSPSAPIHDVSFNEFTSNFRTHSGEVAQVNASQTATVDFRDLLRFQVYTGSAGVLTTQNLVLPFNTNGASLGFKVATTTPTLVAHLAGAYYHGTLNNWSYVTTQPFLHDVTASLEADENQYVTSYPGESSGRQWLERASLDWQFSRNSSFDIGARRLIGPNLPVSFAPPDFAPLDAANISVAYHFLSSKNEFYAVYGDPNSLSTKPALFLKWIRYIGAEKGA